MANLGPIAEELLLIFLTTLTNAMKVAVMYSRR
jgi:hypothetical protein